MMVKLLKVIIGHKFLYYNTIYIDLIMLNYTILDSISQIMFNNIKHYIY